MFSLYNLQDSNNNSLINVNFDGGHAKVALLVISSIHCKQQPHLATQVIKCMYIISESINLNKQKKKM